MDITREASALSRTEAWQLRRGISATWWYTASGVVFFEVFVVLFWTFDAIKLGTPVPAPVVAAGGVVWLLSTLLLLSDYRHRIAAESRTSWPRVVIPLAVAAGYGIAVGVLTESWLLGLMPVAQSLVLLNLPAGIRYRVVAGLTLTLFGVLLIDGVRGAGERGVVWWIPALYTVLLPVMTVSALWWWDVVVIIDRARASEARLAAAQERLRVASDVHDLQGHHLQVIALQLELADRLLDGDGDVGAAREQIRAARASVDEARQGTRDLATRFRSVPLGDELANARDLLRAAGLRVDAEIAVDADAAPADVLGPVVRETTTNVLRHGGGDRARLLLRRDGEGWRYEISNDAVPGAEGSPDGSGLEGVRRRIADATGTFAVVRHGDDFAVKVVVPAEEAP